MMLHNQTVTHFESNVVTSLVAGPPVISSWIRLLGVPERAREQDSDEGDRHDPRCARALIDPPRDRPRTTRATSNTTSQAGTCQAGPATIGRACSP